MNKLTVTEQEKNYILNLYYQNEEFIRPLQKLMECKFTSDGKYVICEGIGYSCETGEIIPINESWTLSDILHTGADILSAGMDFVIPGSGAVIDVLNAISYIIEAQFKSGEEKDSLYIMAAITFGFVILPGPLQAIATPLKRAVKTGVGLASKTVVNGLKIIGKSIDTLLVNIPSRVAAALKSKLSKNILGRWGDKISGFITNFTTRIKSLLGSITGKVGKEGVETSVKVVGGDVFQKTFTISKNCVSVNFCDTKNILKNLMNIIPSNTVFNPSKIKVLSKSNVAGREIIEVQLENGNKTLFYKSSGSNVGSTGKQSGEWFAIPGFAESGWFVKTKESINLVKGGNKYLTEMSQFLQKNGAEGLGKQVSKNVVAPVALQSSKKFFSKTPKILQGAKVLRKAGFAKGHTYKYMGPNGPLRGTIQEITDNGVKIIFTKNGKKSTFNVPIDTFIRKAVGEPWSRRGWAVTVPLFVKRFSDMLLPDGSNIDYSKLDSLEDLNPDNTSKETEEFLSGEVSSYQGNTKEYTIQGNVKIFQESLQLLGYKLPRYGNDGKFGPETKQQLEKFQRDNNLTSSIGKMDRYTARKLSELLKNKKIPNTGNLQTSLKNI